MNVRTFALALALAALALPSAHAHNFAAPIDNPDGRRCYYFDDHDTNTRQVWAETNQLREGGEAEAQEWFGVPAIFGGPGSGLQRDWTPGDDGEMGTEDDLYPDLLLQPTEIRDWCL